MNSKNILAVFLLFIFSFYLIPKEIIHTLVPHKDTIHCEKSNITQVSEEHIHCELLKIDQHFVSNAFELPFYDFNKLEVYSLPRSVIFKVFYLSKLAYSQKQLRAPPL